MTNRLLIVYCGDGEADTEVWYDSDTSVMKKDLDMVALCSQREDVCYVTIEDITSMFVLRDFSKEFEVRLNHREVALILANTFKLILLLKNPGDIIKVEAYECDPDEQNHE